jgi:hypothetical protein
MVQLLMRSDFKTSARFLWQMSVQAPAQIFRVPSDALWHSFFFSDENA